MLGKSDTEKAETASSKNNSQLVRKVEIIYYFSDSFCLLFFNCLVQNPTWKMCHGYIKEVCMK